MNSDLQIAIFEHLDNKKRKLFSQWYTPLDLASKIVGWALDNHKDATRFLEPSAGKGSLLNSIVAQRANASVVCYEIDQENFDLLRRRNVQKNVTLYNEDFLLTTRDHKFDLTIMNPPFEHNKDVEFILKSLSLSPTVVCLLPAPIKHGIYRWKKLWRFVKITREVLLIKRPIFGGSHAPQRDFVVLELERRETELKRGVPESGHTIEWWE